MREPRYRTAQRYPNIWPQRSKEMPESCWLSLAKEKEAGREGWCLRVWPGPEREVESHQPKTPAAQTRTRAVRLKRRVCFAEVGLRAFAAGASVGLGGGRRGVAGERCVPSTATRAEWKEAEEPLRGRFASL